MATKTLRIGISSCLVGQKVRHNGGHLKDSFLNNTLAKFVTWVLVCPEFEVGMGVPREPIRLVGDETNPRLLGARSRIDHTDSMRDWSRNKVEDLTRQDLDGFVLTKDSPSCGLARVRLYPSMDKQPVRRGVGIFAKALTEALSELPVEENGRLQDPRIRENFIDRMFVHRRWRSLFEGKPTSDALVAFHTAHKLTFMAHDPELARILGRIVAHSSRKSWGELRKDYASTLALLMNRIATPRKHSNVLMHLLGHFKKLLTPDDKEEMLNSIRQYREGLIPLVVPLTLFRHHVRLLPVTEWVRQQTYLNPYPDELMLRNHV